MKSLRQKFTVVGIILSCAIIGFGIGLGIGSLLPDAGATGTVTLTLCETTDVHGSYFSSERTSYANVAAYLDYLRDKGIEPVVIDAGDNLQGSTAAYYFNYVVPEKQHIFTRIAEFVGYDAIIVGNHDIETGHSVYDRLKDVSSIPYLAANAVVDGGSGYDSYFKPYTIVERGGVKIAVIGMTNAACKNWMTEEVWSGMDFRPVADVAQYWVDRVRRKEKPQVVVLAVHSGTGTHGEALLNLESEAGYLAGHLRGVDIVFAGHDHQPACLMVDNPNGSVALLNAGAKASNVARCDLTLTLKKGKVKEKVIVPELVPMDGFTPDSLYCSTFKEDMSEVEAFENRKIGYLTGDIDFSEALSGPSAFVSLVHSVQLAASGADISIAAPLSTSGIIKEGIIRYKDLTRLYRFENQLYVVEMTGRELKSYLEFSYDNWVNGTGHSYNFDSADGVVYTVSRSAAKGERVNIVSMTDGTSFDYDTTYKVALNSYRASGGGMLLEKGAGVSPDSLVVLARFKEIRDIIGDYITSVEKIEPEVRNNWKFIE